MADLYETTTPSPPANPPPHEPEDISSFLHHLLHSSSSSASYTPFKAKPMHAFSSAPPLMSPVPGATSTAGTVAPPEDLGFHRFDGSGLGCRFRDGNRMESSSGLHRSDPGVYFPAQLKEGTENLFSSLGGMDSDANASPRRRGFSAENDLGDFSCDSEGTGGASDVNLNPVPSSRPSSKRTRAAEVHNLSEKRRRSRINEKMKALQNLIPNSNKTDKASMLDEAIEYLKQLQLQVQMLSMRNGISLHPMCLPGVMESVQLSHLGMAFDEGNGLLNSNREAGPFSANHESSMQAPIDVPNQNNIPNSDTPFGFQHAPFNIPKEMCKEVILPQQKLEMNASGNNSSSSASGVS